MKLEYTQHYTEQGGRFRTIRVSVPCNTMETGEEWDYPVPIMADLVITDEAGKEFTEDEFVLSHGYDEDWWEQVFEEHYDLQFDAFIEEQELKAQNYGPGNGGS